MLLAVDRHPGGSASLRVECDLPGVEPEDSIAVAGVCLTATAVGEEWFEADLSAETVERTYLASLDPGQEVNLERPLPADGRFHGHVMKGTVDTVTELLDVAAEGEGWRYTVATPPAYADLVVEKGAVGLDGISLTVAAVDRQRGRFDVAIVPQTRAVTTLESAGPGDPMHFEADVLGKYARDRGGADQSDWVAP